MTDRFRSLEHDAFDVIVVGAGTGGLTAAALLAQRGKHVLVCDQHYVAGGNATTFRRPGYEFDVGLHYIGECHPNGAIPRILRAAGVEDITFNLMDQDAYDILHFPDFEFRVSSHLEVYRRRLIDLFPKEVPGIDRYIHTMRRAWEMVHIPQMPLWKGLKQAWKSRTAIRFLQSSLGDFLDTCTHDPKLRAVLTGNQIIYAQPPNRVAALMHILGTMHYMQGPCYPKGGGQIISDRLAETIEERGGKLLLRTQVTKILVEHGRAYGVQLFNKHIGEREVRAPVVISNADIKHTMLDLLGSHDVRPRTRNKVANYEMSPGLGVVYLGLKTDQPKAKWPNCNYVVFPEYDVEPLYDAAREGLLYEKAWTCVTTASYKDRDNPRLAPEGILNSQLMTIVPSQPEAWGVTEEQFLSGEYRKMPSYLEAKQRMADIMLEQAEVYFPNIREQIDFMEACTPLTHRRYTKASEGTSYGIALKPSQFFLRRPDAPTEIKGLYLCGASMRAGHGIPGVMMSGLGAASFVLEGNLFQDVMGTANEVPTSPLHQPKPGFSS